MGARFGRIAVALALAGFVQGTAAALGAGSAPTGILGVWLTGDTSQVTVSACPEGYCGVLTHVATAPAAYARLSPAERKAADAQEPAQFPDSKNKDPALRSRSLVGLQMFVLRPTANPDLFEGTLYNPQDGGTYDGTIKIESTDRILLSGCMFKVLCRSQEWTRIVAAK
jgi:uncharacterized protein (DUF2147 family)